MDTEGHKRYEKEGGEFVSSPFLLKQKLSAVKAIVFDWDGVFHSAYKNETRSSSFSEADSMGVNLLRLGYYLENGTIPFTAVISGEHNPTAEFWCQREHLNAIVQGAKDKRHLLDYLEREHNIESDSVLFVFDDVLDLSLAERVGARFLVSKRAVPGFRAYCRNRNLVDYITFSHGGEHAVREVSEVCLTLIDRLDEVIDLRTAYDHRYQTYFELRQSFELLKLKPNDLKV